MFLFLSFLVFYYERYESSWVKERVRNSQDIYRGRCGIFRELFFPALFLWEWHRANSKHLIIAPSSIFFWKTSTVQLKIPNHSSFYMFLYSFLTFLHGSLYYPEAASLSFSIRGPTRGNPFFLLLGAYSFSTLAGLVHFRHFSISQHLAIWHKASVQRAIRLLSLSLFLSLPLSLSLSLSLRVENLQSLYNFRDTHSPCHSSFRHTIHAIHVAFPVFFV